MTDTENIKAGMRAKIVENWLLKRATAESTKKQYPRHLERFCEFHGLTPEDLIQEADTERQKPVSERVDKAFQRLEEFFQALKTEGKTHDSARNLTMVIKGFYSCSGIHSDWKKPLQKSKYQRDRNHMLNLKKADRLLEASWSFQIKAINAVLRDSALPPGDLCELNIEDLYELEKDWYVIHKTRQKNRERLALTILTFIGPVGFHYLQEWLDWRARNWGPHKPSDPLFLLAPAGTPRTKNEEDRRLTVRALDRHFRKLALTAGLITEKELQERRNPYGPHKYRHLFTTILKNAGMADTIRQTCLGHKVPGIDESYYDTCEKDHFAEYKRFYWQLWPEQKGEFGRQARASLKLELAWDQLKAAGTELGLSEEQLKEQFEAFKREQFGDHLEPGVSAEATIELDESIEYQAVLRFFYRLLRR